MAADPQALLDAVVKHRVWLTRLENAEVRALLGPLQGAVEAALDALKSATTTQERARLANLVAESVGQIEAAYRGLGRALPDVLQDFAQVEARFQARLLSAALRTAVPRPSVEELSALLSRAWAESLGRQRDDTTNALRLSTRLALTAGEGPEGAARRFEPAAGVAVSSAESMARWSIADTTQGVSLHVLGLTDEAADLGPAWLSILDAVTCLTCASNDTLLLSELDDERPPAHPWCRCTIVPVERGVARADYERDSPSGPVHVRTYETWLRRQSAGFQRDVLGPSRYTLFRKGKLPLSKFSDDGRQLSLDELEQRHSEMFAKLFGG